MSEIEQRNSRRLQFLRVVYDLAEGTPSEDVSGDEVADRLGMDVEGDDFHKLANYHQRVRNIVGLTQTGSLLL